MRTAFNISEGVILVSATVRGPRFSRHIRMILDTGAMATGLQESVLASLGVDLEKPAERTHIATASEILEADVFLLNEITALGISFKRMPVIGHRFPHAVEADGVIGLEFFLNRQLVIDLREGWIEVI